MIEVNLQISITRDGEMLLNPERVLLLRTLNECGSLLLASQKLSVSYNKTWKMLHAMNTLTQNAVVEKARGGQGGGGTVLTDFGQLVLAEYSFIEQQVLSFQTQMNTEISM